MQTERSCAALIWLLSNYLSQSFSNSHLLAVRNTSIDMRKPDVTSITRLRCCVSAVSMLEMSEESVGGWRGGLFVLLIGRSLRFVS